ncbi:MAG: hypothetical protein J1F32_03395 [Erysipelotrichales bacterium]|nr:hypothetical protein [Erysipelotrichales bacterium]
MEKPIVFVITPFNEEFLALFDEFKNQFGDSYNFTNAGDLDNQQCILKDIVEGIVNADVIIADLTGLNSNVFYELGLAHAMNKKVIIITQNIDELPFDIKSYRAIQYSLQFNKLPSLMNELQKLLKGAIDGNVKYGNPVLDYAPNLQKLQFENSMSQVTRDNCEEESEGIVENDDRGFVDFITDINYNSVLDYAPNFKKMQFKNSISQVTRNNCEEKSKGIVENDDRGFIDFITDINYNSANMCEELNMMSSELQDISLSVNNAVSEIERVKESNGNVDIVFAKNIFRRLSDPIGQYAKDLHGHNSRISVYWDNIENSYLELLDNKFAKQPQNIEELKKSIKYLYEMQVGINESNSQIEKFIESLRKSIGMERRLNKSINSLISELQVYLTMTDTIFASVDRIIIKSKFIIQNSGILVPYE